MNEWSRSFTSSKPHTTQSSRPQSILQPSSLPARKPIIEAQISGSPTRSTQRVRDFGHLQHLDTSSTISSRSDVLSTSPAFPTSIPPHRHLPRHQFPSSQHSPSISRDLSDEPALLLAGSALSDSPQLHFITSQQR